MYVLHYKRHSHVPNLVYPCGVLGCIKEFNSFGAFNVHVSREHADLRKRSISIREHIVGANSSMRCGVAHCHAVCDNVKQLILHLKVHIESQTAVACPFRNCSKQFENVTTSTFKSHMSRCQKKSGGCLHSCWYVSREESSCDTDDAERNTDIILPDLGRNSNSPVASFNTEEVQEDNQHFGADEQGMFLKRMALFAMDLRSKHNVSETVIQAVIDEYSHLANDNMLAVEAKVKALLGDAISTDLQKSIVQAVRSHPLCATLDLRAGPLRSKHSRTAYYKHTFNFVEPIQMELSNGSHFHYVPIKETLQALFKDENIYHHLQECQANSAVIDASSVLHDFHDGSVCRNDPFFN
jgi:hypothetical protein